ncbi:hypothetical protein A2160_03715 [Candidatus Beckwithbacteria bacterium RBG_13_42_9]|uniref:Uncharacterized protein n=1 Tax=Candidatus Beckwithbacteria bacterium RBG_13_42_9 TaxID=1797457 RepID=A0A1F5E8R6_9BACT|nr:MAG: hypothetical protein A2160_03715 [Candidatus Beckwithbacteria bacterium RBG_13_42_9]
MNKTLIVVGLVLFLLVGGGLLLTMKRSAEPTPSQQTAPAAQNNNSNNTGNIEGTLKSLLSQGKSVKCTYTSKMDSTSSNGTVYVANGKMRGDFQSTSPEITASGHIIVDSQYSYFWSDQSNQGIKMAVGGETVPSPTTQNNQALDLNQPVTYSCSDWTADSSLFTLPKDVTFSTFNLPSLPPASGSDSHPASGTVSPANQCAVCDNIPQGTARDTCKAQLNCP